MRNNQGNVIANHPVKFRFTILKDSHNGEPVSQEIQNVTTNSLGIVNITIGYGVPHIGNFSNTDWANHHHYLKVELDPQGGSNFVELGVTQLLSVPYALYANICGNTISYTAGNGIDISNGVITNTASDQPITLNPGNAISITGAYPNFTISNTAPDQIVTINAGPGVSVSGSYPNFTITNSSPDQSITLNAGNGINIFGTYPSFTIFNSSPDQNVTINSGIGINVSGSYPNFTVSHSSHTGDVNGTTSLTVTCIQNKPISPTPPTIGQVLQYNGSQWTPVNGSAIITAGTGLYYSNNTLNSVWSTNGNYIYNNNLRINRPSWGESVLIESNIDQNDSLGYKHAHMGEYTDYKNYNRWDYISTKCESCYNDIYENQNLFIGIKSNYNNQTSYLNLFLATNISFEITNIKQNLFTRAQRGCNNINGEYNVFLIYDNNNNTNINCNIFTCKESSYKNKSSSNNIHGGIRVEYFGTTELFCTILNCNIEYHLYIEKCNTFYCCNTVWHYNAGNQNTFVEIYCGRSETIVTHSNPNTVYNNTCWKFSVSYYFEQENFNTIIGNDAGYTLKNGTHNVFICYRAGFYNTDSNKINSETYASSNQLIPCEFANDKIAFDRHDDIYFFTVGNNSSNGNRALLTSDAIWTNSFNKTLKNKFEVVSNKKLLDKTLELDIKGWYFKCIQERHVNFIDKYFYNLFYIDIFAELHYLGKSLDASDIARLSLSAIKGLKTIKYTKRSNRKLTKQNKRVKRKKIINKSSQLVKIKIK